MNEFNRAHLLEICFNNRYQEFYKLKWLEICLKIRKYNNNNRHNNVTFLCGTLSFALIFMVLLTMLL
jgi:hypothetical protein